MKSQASQNSLHYKREKFISHEKENIVIRQEKDKYILKKQLTKDCSKKPMMLANRPQIPIMHKIEVPSIPRPKPIILTDRRQPKINPERIHHQYHRKQPSCNPRPKNTSIQHIKNEILPIDNRQKIKKISMNNIRGFNTVEQEPTERIQHQLKNKSMEKPKSQRLIISVENSEKVKEDGTIPIKLVTVGDACVGKTALLISYTTNEFNEESIPTIFENYVADVKCDSKNIKLWLWDTAGQEEYQKIRYLSYQKTDVFLICFSMVDEISFHNAINRWLPEVQEQCPRAFKMFVGTKNDLYTQYMSDSRKNHLLTINHMQKQTKQKNCELMICDSLTQKGLNEVFTKAIRKVTKQLQRKKQKDSSFSCQLI